MISENNYFYHLKIIVKTFVTAGIITKII